MNYYSNNEWETLKDNAYNANLFSIASSETHLKRQSSNEWSGACPNCGGRDRFSVRRMSNGKWVWVCRGCGDGKYRSTVKYFTDLHQMSYAQAIEKLNEDYEPIEIPTEPPQPKKKPFWFGKDINWYHTNFEVNDQLWQSYRNLPPKLIEKYNLRVGVLPMSKCQHERLILPVFNNGELVNLRGRQLNCDCDGKWLASGGWTVDTLPLFNYQAIKHSSVVIVSESPIEPVQIEFKKYKMASLLKMRQEVSNIVGVATYSTVYWRKEWEESLRLAKIIVIGYDNDLAGNGGGERGKIENHKRLLQGLPIIKSNGLKRYEYLKSKGFPVMMLDWRGQPYKMDIGAYLK